MDPARAAPPTSGVDCKDDRGVDRCAPAKQEEVRRRLGVRSIEDLAAQGAQVRRAFFVDGYGRDMPLVSFERMPGRGPGVTVTVQTRGNGGRDDRVEMSAPAPLRLWSKVLRRSEHFERALAPKRKAGADEVSICLHSWLATVEASEPPAGGKPGAVLRRTQDACDDGLAVAYAFELATYAVELLPPCDALERDQHRNEVVLLAACARLHGDRIAAAQTMNRYESDGFARPNRAEHAAVIAHLFYDHATIEWPGEASVRGSSPAAQLWTRKAVAGDRFRPERFIGESANRVRVEGWVEQDGGEAASGEPLRREARAEQIWTQENGFDFRLRAMKVQPFAPARTP